MRLVYERIKKLIDFINKQTNNTHKVSEASTSDSMPKQVRRVSGFTSELPALGESMISASGNSSSVLNELDHAMEALQLRVRPSTATIYRMPLVHWKVAIRYIFHIILSYEINH